MNWKSMPERNSFLSPFTRFWISLLLLCSSPTKRESLLQPDFKEVVGSLGSLSLFLLLLINVNRPDADGFPRRRLQSLPRLVWLLVLGWLAGESRKYTEDGMLEWARWKAQSSNYKLLFISFNFNAHIINSIGRSGGSVAVVSEMPT